MEVLFKKHFVLEDLFMAGVCLVLEKTLNNTFICCDHVHPGVVSENGK